MTRLITEWIAPMKYTASDWDKYLRRQTGMGYLELAARASGNSLKQMKEAAQEYQIAVIPITSGLGTIDSFSESVAAITREMGFQTFVTEDRDVNGIYEACRRGADILYMADDDRYLTLNIRNGKTGDNNVATAQGFSELLDQMGGGLEGKEIAVLGYGIIGQRMAQALGKKGARVSVYDKNEKKRQQAEADGYIWISHAADLKQYPYLADATSEGSWLSSDMLHDQVYLAAPGIPLSLDEKAKESLQGRYVHDLLEIGTAVMLGLVV